MRDVGEGYNEDTVQLIDSGWGAGNFLANFHSKQIGGSLNVFIGGRANGNAVLLFIDSKPGECPMCGMDLMPVDSGAGSGGAEGEGAALNGERKVAY